MGVRLYNSVTGHFTSVDPVIGGNTTRYTYPQDPINQLDLTGKYAIAVPVIVVIAGVAVIVAYAVSKAIHETIRRSTWKAPTVSLPKISKPKIFNRHKDKERRKSANSDRNGHRGGNKPQKHEDTQSHGGGKKSWTNPDKRKK